MRVAVVGGGLIGAERLSALREIGKDNGVAISMLVEPVDAVREKASAAYGAPSTAVLADALADKPDWVFVCTPHDIAAAIAIEALESGANVLVEKPLGRSMAECDAIIAAKKPGKHLQAGFNYRFFRGVDALLADVNAGWFGPLISVKMTLAHGNAPGMEKSWKLNKERCGGGCLIDPGVHLLDLIILIANGELDLGGVRDWRGFWKTGIEEEVHLLLSDASGTIFAADISLNRWRSTFRIEVNGVDGYGVVEGRGRSYGPQSYWRGRRWGWQGGMSQSESEEIVIAADPAADSFVRETRAVLGIADRLGPAAVPPCDEAAARKDMLLLARLQAELT